ncbi:MAG: hypothetical protein Q7S21_05565 [archaeon]|nr:hypothetical protein [archaeon]
MFSTSQLQFAQRFPFSERAKKIIKENDFSLEEIPLEVRERAKVLIMRAFRKDDKDIPVISSSNILLNEISAFPVAKILISLINKPYVTERFVEFVSDSTFRYLEKEEKAEILYELASDLNVKFSIADRKDFFAEIKLVDFLQIDFLHDFMKLVNQKLENGTVFLSRNDFIRFLREIVYKKVHASLPVPTASVPTDLKKLAAELEKQLIEKSVSGFAFSSGMPLGKFSEKSLPPCMDEIFNDLLLGKNVSHIARYNIAVFMASAGMKKEEVIQLFSKTPNWNEKVTSYQVNRLFDKTGTPKLTPASCIKTKEYGLCRENYLCKGIKNPIQLYRRLSKNQVKVEAKEEKQQST